ncbi:MAG: DUF5677 domain-containing protein [Patescibacteria group bacterium]|nr:DUF5677 domain-containing protein [Patescibacteria group bacterium]
MNKNLLGLLERTLKATKPLADTGTKNNNLFLNTLSGIYRVSFSTLRDIYYLSQNEFTGMSALDLTRKIIEYGITVEYMLWKGKEKKAKQFQEYMVVELHNSLEFLKSINQDLPETDVIKSGSKEIECNYTALNKGAKKRFNWAGLSIEKMIEQLYNAGKLSDFDSSRLGEAYVWGCRLNHVSPAVVHNFMDYDEMQIASESYLQQAIVLALIFHFRLSTRYIDEMRYSSGTNVHQGLADEIVALREEFNKLH